MRPVRAPQPKREGGMSWAVGGGIAGIGVLLLAVALLQSGEKPAAPGAEKDAALMQAFLTKSESELAALREKAKDPASELKALQDEGTRLSERIARRNAEVREIEKKNAERRDQLQAQIQAARARVSDEERAADIARVKAQEKNQLSREFQDLLEAVQDSLVTISTPSGGVGTGFMIGGLGTKDRIIVTTQEAAPSGVELLVRTRTAVEDKAEKSDGKILSTYLDKESGLVFLTFDYKGREKLGTLGKDTIREPKAGEKLFTVSTQVLADQVTGFSIFDGTVSAVNRKAGERAMMQLAIASNIGSSGAPILNQDKSLLGIMVGRVKGLEKLATAVPGPEILKAIERMPKK